MSDRLYALATEGLGFVVQALTTAGLASPGRVYVNAGLPALDECCNGHLVAWPSAVYMTEPFPTEALFAQGSCGAASRSVELTFQYAMCVPTLDNNGNAPTADALDAAGETGAIAMLALHRGLACWVAALMDDDTDAYLVGRVEADEPSGGCVSFTGLVLVEVEDCACPAGVLG